MKIREKLTPLSALKWSTSDFLHEIINLYYLRILSFAAQNNLAGLQQNHEIYQSHPRPVVSPRLSLEMNRCAYSREREVLTQV